MPRTENSAYVLPPLVVLTYRSLIPLRLPQAPLNQYGLGFRQVEIIRSPPPPPSTAPPPPKKPSYPGCDCKACFEAFISRFPDTTLYDQTLCFVSPDCTYAQESGLAGPLYSARYGGEAVIINSSLCNP